MLTMTITLSTQSNYAWRWLPRVWTHYSLPGVWAAWGNIRVHIEVSGD